MNFVYGIVIVLFCGCVISFFVLHQRKDKRRHDEIIHKMKEDEKIKQETLSAENSNLQKDDVEPKIDAKLEDFKFDEEVEKPKPVKNPFDDISQDDDLDDDEFAEYEKYLRSRLKLDDNDKDGEKLSTDFNPFDDFSMDDDDEKKINSISDIDYDSLRDKSPEEIRDMIKDLPPQEQQIIMDDILSLKNYDDDEDEPK